MECTIDIEQLQTVNIQKIIKENNDWLNSLFDNPELLNLNKHKIKTRCDEIIIYHNNIVNMNFENKDLQRELLDALITNLEKIAILCSYYEIYNKKEDKITKIRGNIRVLSIINCSMVLIMILMLSIMAVVMNQFN